MEILSIKADTVTVLFHSTESSAVGESLILQEGDGGLVVQVIGEDSLEYPGLQEELLQRVLEAQVRKDVPIDGEGGLGDLRKLKVATAKIRKRVHDGRWRAWDGWIPSRNVVIRRVTAEDLVESVLPAPSIPLDAFTRFGDRPISLDGPRLNMVNVVAGVKGSGKSHLAKHLLLSLAEKHVPVVCFDLNGEYVELPSVQVLRWGDGFCPNLADVGHEMLETVVRIVYSLAPGSPSEAVFETRLPGIFGLKREQAKRSGVQPVIDVPYLRTQTWGGGDFVQGAIDRRLELVEHLGLFWSERMGRGSLTSLDVLYEQACAGSPIVFDMRHLTPALQEALVRSMVGALEGICERETKSGKGRYPFCFFEEAHFYVSEAAILSLITRGRHIGMGSVFVTNTPEKLLDVVFRQLDNLFLLPLTHKGDVLSVSQSSFTDEETIASFATRLPEHHALLVGSVTERYPLILEVDPLPDGVPPTGRTRSTWDRLFVSSANRDAEHTS